jgi:hypothetical protein
MTRLRVRYNFTKRYYKTTPFPNALRFPGLGKPIGVPPDAVDGGTAPLFWNSEMEDKQ